MNKIIKALLFFFTLFLSQALSAQESVNTDLILDYNDAWVRMEHSHAGLRTLLIDQRIALREVESLSHLIPSIGFSANMSRSSALVSSNTNPNYQERPEEEYWSLRAGIDMRLNLKPTVAIENQIQALELNLLLLKREIEIRDLKGDLQKIFYQIDAGKRTISLQERILTLSQARLEQVDAQYKKGLRSELELLSAQLSVSRDKPALQKSRVDQEKRLINIRQYLGLDPGQSIDLIPLNNREMKYEAPDLESLLLLENNLEFRAAALEMEIAGKSRTSSSRNLRSPSLGLSLGWSTNISPPFDSQSWSKEQWGDTLGLGVSLSVPVDPWLKASEGSESLETEDDKLDKLELSQVETLRTIEDSVRSLLLDIELSEANIKVNELNVILQEQTFEKVRQNYENGRTSLYELDNSRQELQKALVALEEEKLKMNLLLIDLEMILGY